MSLRTEAGRRVRPPRSSAGCGRAAVPGGRAGAGTQPPHRLGSSSLGVGVGTCLTGVLRESRISFSEVGVGWRAALSLKPQACSGLGSGQTRGGAGLRSCQVGTIISTLLFSEWQSAFYAALESGMNVHLFPGEPRVCVLPDWTRTPRRNLHLSSHNPSTPVPKVWPVQGQEGEEGSRPRVSSQAFLELWPGASGRKRGAGPRGTMQSWRQPVEASGMAGGAGRGL